MEFKELSNPIFLKIAEIASKKKVKAFVIGGFVRDLLLKRPSKDIDIVVAGSGIELAEELMHEVNPDAKVAVYKNFGTASLHLNDYVIEFVGARKESYRANSRKPIVEDGSLEDDQKRRDFTINALAISLNKVDFGKIIDPFNGIDDINNKIIRTPLDPNITFSDDPLRMLRAIRFVAQLQFSIESSTLQAIYDQKERLQIISIERITDEVSKILNSPKPSIGFKLLFETGLLQFFFPELANLQGVEEKGKKMHKDVFYHTLQVVDQIAAKTDNIWLKWAALLHDIGKPKTKKFDDVLGWTFHGHDYIGSKMIKGIFKRLKLPLNENLTYIEKLVALHLRPIALTEENITDSAIRRLLFEAGNDIDDLMLLCEADITSKNDAKVKQYLHNFQLVRNKLKEIEEKDKLRNWQPPIDGELIMKTFNISPSKEVGIIKTAIREAILDGIIENSFEAAYQFMLMKGKELNLTIHQ